MERMTEEQFEALQVGDRVLLLSQPHMKVIEQLAVVSSRTAKTVTVRTSRDGPRYIIRRARGGREHWLQALTPEKEAEFVRADRIGRISSYLFQLDRQGWRDVSDSVLDLFDIAVDAYVGVRQIAADQGHDRTRATPNQPHLVSPAGDDVTRIDAEGRAAEIVQAILSDLTDRRGFDHAWDAVDSDIQDEMRTKLEQIVTQHLRDEKEG